MGFYYLNKNAQETGEHEVHEAKCEWLPEEQNCLTVGECVDGNDAVETAKILYPKVAVIDGCEHCAPEAHNR